MSGRGASRRDSLKSRIASQQQKRRDAARQRQKDARRDFTNYARSLAFGDHDGGGDDGDGGERDASSSFAERDEIDALNAAEGICASRGAGSQSSLASADADALFRVDSAPATAAAMEDAEARGRGATAEEATDDGHGRRRKQRHRRSSSAPGKWSDREPSRGTSFGETQFMLPEWMIDVPPDLASGWFAIPRPEGRRCLVVSSRGGVVSRLRSGRPLHRFKSALPGGSDATRHGPDAFCILDCVFHERDQTYYVLDCLAWNSVSLYDCAAEMRVAWVRGKLGDAETAECDAARGGASYGQTPSPQNKYAFAVPPTHDADVEGLRAAYEGAVPFERDGILFLAKDGNYAIGASPLALQWKDARCSKHVLEKVDGDDGADETQRVVLCLDASTGDVCTGDVPPVALARLPEEYRVGGVDGDAHGLLLRFAIGEGGIVVDESGAIARVDLVYEGLANQRRASGADATTKILFQYYARREPITIDEIARVAEGSSGDAAAPWAGDGGGSGSESSLSAPRPPASPGALMRRSHSVTMGAVSPLKGTNVGGVRVEDIAMDE
ncbi:mRNA_cap_enzyme [Micromonas pusilla CCMP1545]|uniref:Snurportin-1 n=1 Tax=Micromonas pusilla (strain CCMP1545) TaxID=564608 RepID=C1MTJ2_MICPC|nr:mRNA_cap_enzyme [Micromonas pusilla CCMP1545]EEH56954.1 mRNA_cap_enzyme [Micromonas pusilla CCMP1545]|eukprot:XP_003058499.1 mRNA_cap_enzyme [Micromonas pusilla CCMP1545]